MICNVILNKVLYQGTEEHKSIFQDLKVTTRTITRDGTSDVQRNVYRHIISYADDIVITTSNKEELPFIMSRLTSALKEVGLSISLSKTQIITYDPHENNQVKFDYLG